MKRILSAVSILVILIGCAKEKATNVAKVGDLKITLEELEKRLPPREFKSEAEELNVKKATLDDLIEDKLFILEAKNRGYDKEEEHRKSLEKIEQETAIKQMYNEMIEKKVEATDEDVGELWQKLGEEAKVRVIVVETKEEAEQVLEELKGGSEFEQLAKAKSIDKKTALQGGDIGYVTWDRFDDKFSQAIFALNPGEIGDVVELRDRYYLIKVEDRREVEQKDFEVEKERLTKIATMRKRRAAAEDFLYGLKKKADITFDDEVLSWIEEKIEAQVTTPGGMPELTPEERKKVVVRFDNEEWSIEDLFEKFGPRIPPLRDIKMVKNSVEGLVLNELLWSEARRRGMHKGKEVREKVKEGSDMNLIRLMKREASQTDSQPTEQELLDYYNFYKDRYKDKEFEQVKGRIRLRLIRERSQQQERNFLNELKEKYSIEIYEENLLSKEEAEEE